MENIFLDDDYEVPNTTPYMKFQDGDNIFRILTKPIIGWQDWTLEKKPIRFRMNEKPLKSIDAKKPFKHLWAMVVWNYHLKQIQILEITQKSIQESIKNLSKDPDWGNPATYDIKVHRKGSDLTTEYSTSPKPHKAISDDIKEAFASKPCNLDKLFTGDDPFAPYEETTEILTDMPF